LPVDELDNSVTDPCLLRLIFNSPDVNEICAAENWDRHINPVKRIVILSMFNLEKIIKIILGLIRFKKLN